MLKKAGWSWQKPQRVPVQRDDEAVKYWARRVMPRIKKARDLAATLVFADESGFCRKSSEWREIA
jgi:hypothetical protein